MEMDIEVVSLIVSASIPLILFYFGRKIQDYQNVIERRHKPRIQFDLEMNLFGPQGEYYLAEIFAVLQNKGHVEKEFHQITLEVLGVEKESEIELFVKTTLKDEKEEENTIKKGKKANKDALVGFPEIIVKSNFLNPSKKNRQILCRTRGRPKGEIRRQNSGKFEFCLSQSEFQLSLEILTSSSEII